MQFSFKREAMIMMAPWMIAPLVLLLGGPDRSGLPGLHYLDDVGRLGTEFDRRTSVSFGGPEAVADNAGHVWFEGYDDDGRIWRAVLPVQGGIAPTEVWTADFDRNSRPDLLIAALSATSGRCIDGVTLFFLLFDAQGRPVPWVVETHRPRGNRYAGKRRTILAAAAFPGGSTRTNPNPRFL